MAMEIAIQSQIIHMIHKWSILGPQVAPTALCAVRQVWIICETQKTKSVNLQMALQESTSDLTNATIFSIFILLDVSFSSPIKHYENIII